MTEQPFRLLPRITPENEHYWTGGAQGELRFLRCTGCGHYLHPPQPLCPECLSRDLEVAAVSGRAELHTYTVNHQPWIPGFPPPYVVAIVEIPEQSLHRRRERVRIARRQIQASANVSTEQVHDHEGHNYHDRSELQSAVRLTSAGQPSAQHREICETGKHTGKREKVHHVT